MTKSTPELLREFLATLFNLKEVEKKIEIPATYLSKFRQGQDILNAPNLVKVLDFCLEYGLILSPAVYKAHLAGSTLHVEYLESLKLWEVEAPEGTHYQYIKTLRKEVFEQSEWAGKEWEQVHTLPALDTEVWAKVVAVNVLQSNLYQYTIEIETTFGLLIGKAIDSKFYAVDTLMRVGKMLLPEEVRYTLKK